MQKQYLMGQDNWLLRSPISERQKTYISPRLKQKLIELAVSEAFDYYASFLGQDTNGWDYRELAIDYQRHLEWGHNLGLFGRGSIPDKDHLSLWCLARIFAPKTYIESGVFIGSSLHAFLASSCLEKAIAIDPDLEVIRIPKSDLPNAELIDDRDFSQLELEVNGSSALAYFDDHIDTAARIEQAASKGLKYVLFDDSTGLEGIVQGPYPAIPTLPMIVNHEWFEPGDEIGWMYEKQSQSGSSKGQTQPLSRHIKDAIKSVIYPKQVSQSQRNSPSITWISLSMTEQLLDKCRSAKARIEGYCQLPDLGLYMPQAYPRKTGDTTKYLVKLRTSNSQA